MQSAPNASSRELKNQIQPGSLLSAECARLFGIVHDVRAVDWVLPFRRALSI